MQRRFLFLLGLFLWNSPAFAQGIPAELVHYADNIFVNGKIITVDERASVAQAVAVRDGKILAVGQNAQILKLAGPKTTRIDLKGKTMLPGLVDTHSHLQEYALDHWGEDHPLLKYTKVGGKNDQESIGSGGAKTKAGPVDSAQPREQRGWPGPATTGKIVQCHHRSSHPTESCLDQVGHSRLAEHTGDPRVPQGIRRA